MKNISSKHPTRCADNYRMDATRFDLLCQLLKPHIKTGMKLTLEVQVAIYLDWVSFATKYRQQQNHFKLSKDSIKTARKRVGYIIVKHLYPLYVKMDLGVPDLQQIFPEQKQFHYFQGAYGLIDGSHLPIFFEADLTIL
jgi:hypothetical protein